VTSLLRPGLSERTRRLASAVRRPASGTTLAAARACGVRVADSGLGTTLFFGPARLRAWVSGLMRPEDADRYGLDQKREDCSQSAAEGNRSQRPEPQGIVRMMNITQVNIWRSGIWLTLPPLLFSLILLNILPSALTPAEFNQGIPPALLLAENLLRIFTFAVTLLFSIGLSKRRQKWGLAVYALGVGSYFLSYGTQNFFPESAWSVSFVGFIGSAFINVFWMVGLGMMGDKINFWPGKTYRPAYYIIPAILFLAVHTTHAAIYYKLTH